MKKIKLYDRFIQSKPFVIGLVLILLSFGVPYLVDKAIKICGVQKLVNANHEYLQKSAEKSGASFLVLSGIKGGVSILEGSTVGADLGATVNVQVGDAVQPIYDFIDIAWRVTFISGVILLLTMLLLDVIFQWGPTALFLAFLSGMLLWLISNKFPKIGWGRILLRRTCGFFFICAFGIYLILPLTTGFARYLSSKISAPMINQGMEELHQLERDSSPAAMQKRFFPEGEKTKEQLNIKQKAIKILSWCKEITKRVITRGIQLCAGFIFDCVVFPFAILLAIYVFLRQGFSIFALSTQQSMKGDLRWLGEKYLKWQGDCENRKKNCKKEC